MVDESAAERNGMEWNGRSVLLFHEKRRRANVDHFVLVGDSTKTRLPYLQCNATVNHSNELFLAYLGLLRDFLRHFLRHFLRAFLRISGYCLTG